MASSLGLTREQLAKFLGRDLQAIRAFENFLQSVNNLIPADLQSLQDRVDAIDTEIAAINSAVDSINTSISTINASIASISATISGLGTMSTQDADNVAITGGVVAATQIKNGQTSALIESTVLLNNQAAAAVGTLLNAPTAGNPVKWVPIIDNGTVLAIPAWGV